MQSELTECSSFAFYFVGVFFLAGLISLLSYRFIESPFLRIKPK